MKTEEKGIFYVYAEPTNETYINGLVKEFNLPKTDIINRIIEGHRLGKRPKFEKHIPKYVQRAQEWQKKADI